MLDNIVKILEELDIKSYQINETTEESVELFFIKKVLDMKRRKDVTKYIVNVFHDFIEGDQKMRGSSSTNIYSTMKEDEIKTALQDAYFAASFVKNPYYELPTGKKEDIKLHNSSLSKNSLEDSARLMTEALFKEDKLEDSFLNSAELFVQKLVKRIVNSEGIDVSYDQYKVTGEFVAQCIEPTDVETYQDFSYEELDTTSLEKKVKDTLEMTTARAKAKSSAESGEYKVILSGQYVRDFISYYETKASSNMIFPHYSDYKVGTRVQKEDAKGEMLNVTLIANEPYSEEGIPMIDRPLLEDGVLMNIHGSLRFSRYLDIEPIGYYQYIKVKEGTMSFDEMKVDKYLHIVNFSDFQVDSFTGYFGGEIRLAFYHDGSTVIPVTGGSISGNITEVSGKLTFSTQMQKETGYEGPYALCIEKVTVAQ